MRAYIIRKQFGTRAFSIRKQRAAATSVYRCNMHHIAGLVRATAVQAYIYIAQDKRWEYYNILYSTACARGTGFRYIIVRVQYFRGKNRRVRFIFVRVHCTVVADVKKKKSVKTYFNTTTTRWRTHLGVRLPAPASQRQRYYREGEKLRTI